MSLCPDNAKSAEFAPGIPQKGQYGNISKDLKSGQPVDYFLQKHTTTRNPTRPHYDLRLGTPDTGLYSWAIPKAELPEPGERRLAPATFKHEYSYGSFSGRLGKGYGSGQVELADRGEALLTKVTPNTVSFTLSHKRTPYRYSLVRMKDRPDKRQWLLVGRHAGSPDVPGVGHKPVMRLLKADNVDDAIDQASEVQAKIDGAHAIVDVDDKGNLEVYSVRRGVDGNTIVHTDRLGLTGLKLPRLANTTFRSEIYGMRDGEAVPFNELSGMLNANVPEAVRRQQETGTKLMLAPLSVIRYKGRQFEKTSSPLYHYVFPHSGKSSEHVAANILASGVIKPGGEVPGTEKDYADRPTGFGRDPAAVYLTPHNLKVPEATHRIAVDPDKDDKVQYRRKLVPLDRLEWALKQVKDPQSSFDKAKTRKFKSLVQIIRHKAIPVTPDMVEKTATNSQWLYKLLSGSLSGRSIGRLLHGKPLTLFGAANKLNGLEAAPVSTIFGGQQARSTRNIMEKLLVPRLREGLKTAGTLYHGSPSKLDQLQPQNKHGDPDVDKAIFASPNRTFALPYAADKWGDRELQQTTSTSKRTGKTTMKLYEMRPGVLDKMFAGKQGYMYHLPDDGFKTMSRRGIGAGKHELISTQPVNPAKVEIIADVLRELKSDPNVKLLKYNPKSPDMHSHFSRMAKRLKAMDPEHAEEYLNWWKDGATPEMLAMLQSALTKTAQMTLDEAIQHANEVAKQPDTCGKCADEHLQLARWLVELKRRQAGDTKTAAKHDNNGYVLPASLAATGGIALKAKHDIKDIADTAAKWKTEAEPLRKAMEYGKVPLKDSEAALKHYVTGARELSRNILGLPIPSILSYLNNRRTMAYYQKLLKAHVMAVRQGIHPSPEVEQRLSMVRKNMSALKPDKEWMYNHFKMFHDKTVPDNKLVNHLLENNFTEAVGNETIFGDQARKFIAQGPSNLSLKTLTQRLLRGAVDRPAAQSMLRNEAANVAKSYTGAFSPNDFNTLLGHADEAARLGKSIPALRGAGYGLVAAGGAAGLYNYVHNMHKHAVIHDERQALDEIMTHLPVETFQRPVSANDPAGAYKLLARIRKGKEPTTREGIVVIMPDGTKRKYKLREDVTAYLQGTYPGIGKRTTTAGGLLASLTPKGPANIRLGTGFKDKELIDIIRNMKTLKGSPMRVQHQGKFENTGLLRAPSYGGFETDKPLDTKYGQAMYAAEKGVDMLTHGLNASTGVDGLVPKFTDNTPDNVSSAVDATSNVTNTARAPGAAVSGVKAVASGIGRAAPGALTGIGNAMKPVAPALNRAASAATSVASKLSPLATGAWAAQTGIDGLSGSFRDPDTKKWNTDVMHNAGANAANFTSSLSGYADNPHPIRAAVGNAIQGFTHPIKAMQSAAATMADAITPNPWDQSSRATVGSQTQVAQQPQLNTKHGGLLDVDVPPTAGQFSMPGAATNSVNQLVDIYRKSHPAISRLPGVSGALRSAPAGASRFYNALTTPDRRNLDMSALSTMRGLRGQHVNLDDEAGKFIQQPPVTGIFRQNVVDPLTSLPPKPNQAIEAYKANQRTPQLGGPANLKLLPGLRKDGSSHTATCHKCGHKFDYANEPETAMGSVACPKCKHSVTQSACKLAADIRAHIRSEAKKVDTKPTQPQIRAGNYVKGHVKWMGLSLTIENPKHSIRRGKDKNNKAWCIWLKDHYGYIRKSESEADNQHVDMFMGEHPESTSVYVVDQLKSTGGFDEHKVILGCLDADEAKKCYLRNYSSGWAGFGGITALTVDQLKTWLQSGDTSKPIHGQSIPVSKVHGANLIQKHAISKEELNDLAAGTGVFMAPSIAAMHYVHKLVKELPNLKKIGPIGMTGEMLHTRTLMPSQKIPGFHNAAYVPPDSVAFFTRMMSQKLSPGHRLAMQLKSMIGKHTGMLVYDDFMRRKPIIEHELGHAAIDRGYNGKTMQFAQKHLYMPGRLSTSVMPLVAAIIGHNRGMNRGLTTGAAGSAATLPMLASEAKASLNAVKRMRESGANDEEMRKAKRSLRHAWMTYATSATAPVAGAMAGSTSQWMPKARVGAAKLIELIRKVK